MNLVTQQHLCMALNKGQKGASVVMQQHSGAAQKQGQKVVMQHREGTG